MNQITFDIRDKDSEKYWQRLLKNGKETRVCLKGIFYEGKVVKVEGLSVTMDYECSWRQPSWRERKAEL
jgi:hypothetical protein